MSDLIERLRQQGRYNMGGSLTADAADQLEAQQAEIARLQELVERAYKEGFGDGFSSTKTRSEMWERSKARKELEQKP